jgi:putative DNA-invertase from lambdoid prophage Rac
MATKMPRPAPEPARLARFRRRTGRGSSGRSIASPGANTAAAYLRVSSRGQDPENQQTELERLALVRGYDVRAVYVERGSATRGSRPIFDGMLADAHRGQFRVLLVWALDRFGRSLARNVNAVLELERLGVTVISVREPWLDTGGPVRSLLIAIFSWVAEQETRRLGERTRAGLERARARGQRLGRPARVLSGAHELERVGTPIRVIAQRLKTPRATIHRALRLKKGTRSEMKKAPTKRRRRRASQKRTNGGR